MLIRQPECVNLHMTVSIHSKVVVHLTVVQQLPKWRCYLLLVTFKTLKYTIVLLIFRIEIDFTLSYNVIPLKQGGSVPVWNSQIKVIVTKKRR